MRKRKIQREKKDKDDEITLEHSKGDEYNMNEHKGLHDLEMDPDYEWLGVWDTTEKDEKIVKLHEKETSKVKENGKKTTKKGGVDGKKKEKGKEKKKEVVMKINQSTTFTGLLLESSSSEDESSDNHFEYDESNDLKSINSEDSDDQQAVKIKKIFHLR